MAMSTTQKRLAANRDTYVRVLAALIEAERFIRDPKNADAVAKAAAATSRSVDEAKWATNEYVKMEFWPRDKAGLNKENIEAIIAAQKRVGGIRPDATPVAYERFADLTVFNDAMKMAK
jgi:ABC-type nitrate/sulfonate/bicarbonate transport system substrate-binding protein